MKIKVDTQVEVAMKPLHVVVDYIETMDGRAVPIEMCTVPDIRNWCNEFKEALVVYSQEKRVDMKLPLYGRRRKLPVSYTGKLAEKSDT